MQTFKGLTQIQMLFFVMVFSLSSCRKNSDEIKTPTSQGQEPMMFFGATFGSKQCIGLYTLYHKNNSYSLNGGCSVPYYGAYPSTRLNVGSFYLNENVFHHNSTNDDISYYLSNSLGNMLYGDSVLFSLSGNPNNQVDHLQLNYISQKILNCKDLSADKSANQKT